MFVPCLLDNDQFHLFRKELAMIFVRSTVPKLLCVVCVAFFLLSGCTKPHSFHLKNLAKTDIDDVSDIHFNGVTQYIKALTEKLYKRNPAELLKKSGETIETRMEKIFQCPAERRYTEVEMKIGTDAILLGFNQDYEGDRVFAMMYGLYTMVLASYNNKCELFFLDQLSEQNLYYSARNIETFVWRLKNRKKDNGQLFLLTNSLEGPVQNLSYERLFGKMIALQDSMTQIVADRTGRVFKEIVQVTGMAFLPIPI